MNLSPASAFTAPSPSSSSSWRRHLTRKQKRRAPAVRSNHLSSFESSHFIVETTRFHRPDFVCCFSPFSHLVPSRSTPPHPLPTPSHRLRFDFSRSNCLELVSFFWNPQLLLDENNPPEGGGGGGGFLFFLRLCRPFSCLACVPYHVSTLRNASKKKKEEGEGQEKRRRRRRRRRRRWRTSPV